VISGAAAAFGRGDQGNSVPKVQGGVVRRTRPTRKIRFRCRHFRITPSGSLGFRVIVDTIDAKPVSSLCRHDHVSKAFTRTGNQSLPVCDPDSAKEKPDDKYLPELAVNSEMRMTPMRVKPLPASPSKRPSSLLAARIQRRFGPHRSWPTSKIEGIFQLWAPAGLKGLLLLITS